MDTFYELKQKHDYLYNILIEYENNTNTINNNENIISIKQELQNLLELLDKTYNSNNKLMEQLYTLNNKQKQLNIMKKYIECKEKLEKYIENINNILKKENKIWDILLKSSPKNLHINKNTWIRESSILFNELEENIKNFSHIHSSLSLLKGNHLTLLNYSLSYYNLFIESIQKMIKQRIILSLEEINWPMPSHKLTDDIIPLVFSNDINTNIHIINLLIHQDQSKISQIDSRLEIFVALFIYGIRLQNAFHIENNDNIWTLDILYEPILSRFMFHFMNEESSTNRIDKPEWCISYISNTITDHLDIMLNYIQPLLNRESQNIITDAKNLLIKQLLLILEEKLLVDIPLLLEKHQHIYCKTLSECVKLQDLLYNIHNYPESYTSPLQVFAYNSKLLDAWIKIEIHVMKKQLKRILKNPNKWERHLINLEDIDELKPTISAESIIIMIENITIRYYKLKDINDKIRFYNDIQKVCIMEYCYDMNTCFSILAEAEVLNDSLIKDLCKLSNSANYCLLIMMDWSEQIYFLQMQYEIELQNKLPKEKEQYHFEDVKGLLFQEPIDLCKRILNKSLKGLSSAISRSFHFYSEPYFNQSKNKITNIITYDVSPDMCTPLYEVKQSIDIVLEELAGILLPQFWEIFIKELDSYILSDIIEGKSLYTQNSAEQLRFNMKVLFSFVQPYYKEDNIFSKTKDCIHILTMDIVDLQQLKSDLYLINSKEQQQILNEYRINSLSGRETEILITKRRDITKL